MPSNDIRFQAAAAIHARPEAVWAILTDYEKAHPSILPPEAFSDYTVLSGGHGDGTVVSFIFKAGGARRAMRATVSVPAEGQTLIETSMDGASSTTFNLSPLDDGRNTHLTITTVQAGHSGLLGIIERLATALITPAMRRIYQDEMRRLDDLAQRRQMSEPPSAS